MLFTTLTTLLATTSLVAAAPAAAPLEKRACQIKYPTNLFSVIEASTQQNTGNNGYTFTGQGAGKTNRYITELQFTNIPAGAYGCSVEYFFQKGWRVESTPDTRLDFFVPDRNISLADTWVNRPGRAYQVGTQIVRGSATEDVKLTAVTGACAETLNYIIEVQGDKAGSVGFSQGNGNGLRLTYNC
ncbi:hypothetical protein BDZ85DRAFT_250969 [Elsinoe ampelina]|uniref:Ubiquitin 3 binding protein But2 C-terminal domain-containing protein n=1 Tax=Elsinoe ampelina TaxID=302913 RepID=A0A6A6G985_9PEZI|nr:hypothetical protein BDZ85DRAFT_250969 [Elsinoe ampelina]